jgi:hydroxymethylglutaryl-CoA lyase
MPAEPKTRPIERRRGALSRSKQISWNVSLPKSVLLREVGPQDGLAGESVIFPILTKLQLIRSLVEAGASMIEVTAFVDPDRVPQLADAEEVARQLPRRSDVIYSALVEDVRGVERAIAAGVDEWVVRIPASADPADASAEVSREILLLARRHRIPFRGKVTDAFRAPSGGRVDTKRVADAVTRLLDLGCSDVTLVDDEGRATPKTVWKVLDRILQRVPAYLLAAHFHDTYGLGAPNALAAIASDVRIFESSIGGLGVSHKGEGVGNIATEDLVFVLEGMGVRTNLSLEKLVGTSARIERFLNHPIPSRVYRAEKSRR